MKSLKKSYAIDSVLYLLVCAAFTVAVRVVDTAPVGYNGGTVGFSFINDYFQKLFPFNQTFYTVTQLLGYFALAVAAAFGVFGIVQLIKRKSLLAVDGDIIALGVFYVLVLITYAVFTKIPVNYRPVVIDAAQGLETSFPSSHTMLAVCVFITAGMQIRKRIKGRLGAVLSVICAVLTVFMIVGRIISGVHWFTDILGGILYSCFFISVYKLLGELLKNEETGKHDRQ